MKRKILLTTIGPRGEDNLQLALYYLKIYFLKHSSKVKLGNIEILSFSHRERIETVIDRIKKAKPEIIGFSCYVWNILKILKVAKVIKKDMPHVKVVFGGSEVSPRAYRLMKNNNFIDAIVIGEGERTFKELLERWLDNKADISDIDGIACRKSGRVLLTKKREQIRDLDEIPSPYLEKIVDEKCIKDYRFYIPTETMRGCIFKCHYCYYHKDFEKLSYFSLGRVEKELKYLLEREPRGIYLMDPTFNLDKKRAKDILRIIIKYNKKTNLHIELRAELLDEEMIGLLHKARTDFIEIGIQSTNKKTLRLINRYFEPHKFKQNILYLNKKGLLYQIQLIDGLPADNYQTLKKSVDWLFAFRPRKIKIMRFMLLPGTYLRLNASRLGIKYNYRAPYHSIKSDTFSYQDLKKTKKLRTAIITLYDSGLLRNSIYLLIEKFGIDFSDVFDEWNAWTRKKHDKIVQPLENKEDNKIKNTASRLRIIKRADMAVDFVEYLCQKYNKPYVAEQISNTVYKDKEKFLKRRGITVKALRH